MIIGGESEEQVEYYIQKNIKKYIPISLCGHVHCKCIGAIHKGDTIVVSNIPGIGRAKSFNENVEFTQIVGYAVDEDLARYKYPSSTYSSKGVIYYGCTRWTNIC